MGHVQDNAAESVRRVIDGCTTRDFAYRDRPGHGHHASRITRRPGQARRRRSTSPARAPQQPNNFNAPEPVTRAAVLYVFRVMVEDDIPMNAGCLRPIDIVIPEGSMLSPRYPAAVVAGNVETSQTVTDCLFGALGAHGPGAGHDEQSHLRQRHATNITRRSARARRRGPGFDGAAAVHTHMTNSRLTDPEVLELRFPVLLEDFHIRRGSGGQRQMACAATAPRARIRFLERMDCAILVRPSPRAALRRSPAASPARSARPVRRHGRPDRDAWRAATRPC